MRPRVALLALGGTISSEREGTTGGAVPRLSAAGLLAFLEPDLQRSVEVLESPAGPRASSALGESDLVAVATTVADAFADGVDGIVVTVGTDTLEEIAFGLDVLVGDRGWIVVTGAMRAASVAGTDGPANLAAALRVAGEPLVGTVVVMGDQIYNPQGVRKLHTSLPGAFGGHGAHLGEVTEQQVVFYARPVRRGYGLKLEAITEPAAVALVTGHLGDTGVLLDPVPSLGYQGVVYEALGGGHVHPDCVQRLAALSSRIPVVLTSRTGAGALLARSYGFPGSEVDVAARTACYAPTAPLSGPKARLLLSLQLGAGISMADSRGFAVLGEVRSSDL